jgi:phospholipase C
MRDRRRFMFAARIAGRAAALSLLAGVGSPGTALARDGGSVTASPIEHLVVIFQENVSFDHYFGTYPVALNPRGEPTFHALNYTPSVNGLGTLIDGQPEGVLLTRNPNAINTAGNSADAINPFRLGRSQASTCDQDHSYGDEQKALDQGLMDLFPATVGVGSSSFCNAAFSYGRGKGLVMGYFDGNTVTALWNYAQNFAMNDNSFGTTFGPSTPGLLNLVSGNTYPATVTGGSTSGVVAITSGVGTVVGDPDPIGESAPGRVRRSASEAPTSEIF